MENEQFIKFMDEATHLLSVEAAKLACVTEGVDVEDIAHLLMNNYLSAYNFLRKGNNEFLRQWNEETGNT